LEDTVKMGGTGRRVELAEGVERDDRVRDHAKVNTVRSHTSAIEMTRFY
jgi:hypothetical protein